MLLRMILDRPIHGFWDGGAKDTFDFTIYGTPQHDAHGAYIKVGSWAANNWFHVALGKTIKQNLANARRRLSASARSAGEGCHFEYIEEPPNLFERQAFGDVEEIP